jgi:hypothetical protein
MEILERKIATVVLEGMIVLLLDRASIKDSLDVMLIVHGIQLGVRIVEILVTRLVTHSVIAML